MKIRIFIWLFLIVISAKNFPQEWVVQNPLPASSNLNSVYFFNDTVGIALGSGGKLLKTTNGGVNWIERKIAGIPVQF